MNENLENMVLKVYVHRLSLKGNAVCLVKKQPGTQISVPNAGKYMEKDILVKITQESSKREGLDTPLYRGNFLTSQIPSGFTAKSVKDVVFYCFWNEDSCGSKMPMNIDEINKFYDPGRLTFAYFVQHLHERNRGKLIFHAIYTRVKPKRLHDMTLGQHIDSFREAEQKGWRTNIDSRLLVLDLPYFNEERVKRTIVKKCFYPLKLEWNPIN